jgi:hypothetical protein
MSLVVCHRQNATRPDELYAALAAVPTGLRAPPPPTQQKLPAHLLSKVVVLEVAVPGGNLQATLLCRQSKRGRQAAKRRSRRPLRDKPQHVRQID